MLKSNNKTGHKTQNSEAELERNDPHFASNRTLIFTQYLHWLNVYNHRGRLDEMQTGSWRSQLATLYVAYSENVPSLTVSLFYSNIDGHHPPQINNNYLFIYWWLEISSYNVLFRFRGLEKLRRLPKHSSILPWSIPGSIYRSFGGS